MAFTSREFPGRSFATKEEYEQAKEEKACVERAIKQPPDVEVELESDWPTSESDPIDSEEHPSLCGE